MKLQIMSDLHFEMHADGGAELIRELDPTGVEVLVLAGDITMARHYANLEGVFKPLAKKYRHILYVPGNHEYYKSSPTEVARNLAKLTKALPQVVIPENDTVVIAGQRFIAGTMWFRADPAAEPNKRLMHDFSLIQDFEPWVYEQNAAFEKVLGTQVRAGDVVVTHHLPAFESVSARFARSAMNAFFVCDMAPQHARAPTEALDSRPQPRSLRLPARQDARRREPARLSERGQEPGVFRAFVSGGRLAARASAREQSVPAGNARQDALLSFLRRLRGEA